MGVLRFSWETVSFRMARITREYPSRSPSPFVSGVPPRVACGETSTRRSGVVQESVGGRRRGGRKKGARAAFANRSGGPVGSTTSRGTRAVYFAATLFRQHAQAAAACLSAQGLWTRLPAASREPAVLSGPRVPEAGASLAERPPSTAAAAMRRGASTPGFLAVSVPEMVQVRVWGFES